MLTSQFSTGESYVSTSQAEPTPLFGELTASKPVPWEFFGPFAKVIRAISTLTQAPDEIAMQSVLIVVSLATQAHADVDFLIGSVPLSCFALTVAQSGERKSACDKLASTAVERFDVERVRRYHREKREFDAAKLAYQKGKRHRSKDDFDVVDDDARDVDAELPPEPPLYPHIRIDDPTIEGLVRHLENGFPSVAVMTDEGGHFFGGHSMKRKTRLKLLQGFQNFGMEPRSPKVEHPQNRSRLTVSVHRFI